METIVTAYCICALCCGKAPDHPEYGIGAAGRRVVPGRSAAANWIPFGTRVEIPGLGIRTVEDRMARRFSDRLDVLMPSHSEALAWGKRKLRVRILNRTEK